MVWLIVIVVAILFFVVLKLSKKLGRLEYELDYFRSRAHQDVSRLQKEMRDLRGEPAAATTPEPELQRTIVPEPVFSTPPAEPVPTSTPAPAPEPAPGFSAPEPQPQPVPAAAREAHPQKPSFDFESLVGIKLFSWIAGIALVLAAVFFLRYSIDHGWITPPIRMAMGFATGAGLLLFSSFRFGRNYPVTANALDGAGVAILYATTYASHALWELIPMSAAFVLMAIVTVVAVFLSIRRDSLFIALLGMLGGFATPAVLSSGENRPVALFSYLLILNAGLAWTAHRRRWPLLLAASVAFTAFYQLAWAGRFLDAAQLPLSTAIFLAFPILFTVFHLVNGSKDDVSPLFRGSVSFAGLVPLAFSIYTAAIPAIGTRFHILFGFLLLAVAGFAFVAVRVAKDPLTGGLPAVATLVVFAVWLARGWTPAAWPAILGWLALFVVLFAFGPLLLRRLGENGMIDRSTIVAGVLLFAIAPIIARAPATESPALIFLVAAALLCAVAASAFRTARHGDLLTGALAIFVAQAFWTFRRLGPETFRAAMVVYAGLALLTLAIALLGRMKGFARSSYVALGAYLLLAVAANEARLDSAPLLAALSVIAIACALAALLLRRPSLHLVSILGAFAVLTVWEIAHEDVSVAAPAWAAFAFAAFAILCIAAARRVSGGGSIGETPLAPWTLTAIVAIVALQWVTVGGATTTKPIPAGAIAAILVAAPLAFAALTFLARWHAVALVAVATTALSATGFRGFHDDERMTALTLAVAAAHYAIFTLYPFALGRRAGRASTPALVAVAGSVPFFFFARDAMKDWGLEHVIGLLPVALGLVLLALLRRNVTLEREAGEDVRGRRALVAGAALAFFTAAIPLQLEKEWVTIGWALEAAALAWLFGRIRHRGLLAWSAGLFAVVFIRLVFNPAVFSYHPRSATAIVNWYFYTYAVAAAAFYSGARLLRRLVDDTRVERKLPKVLAAGGTLLLFLLLNIEIADFYSTGDALTFDFFSASLAQELTYTLGWALFAIALLLAGIAGASRGARIAAIALLSLTVFKCFLYDLGRLGGLYRVGSFVGLAISLALVAVLLQKFALRRSGRSGLHQEPRSGDIG